MRQIVAVFAVLVALTSLGASPSCAVAAPAVVRTGSPVDRFSYDPESGVAQQDQLARQLNDAASRGYTLQVPKGRVVLTRTLWLPPGATLELAAGAIITGAIPGQSLVRLQSGSHLVGGAVKNTSASDCFDVDVANKTRNAVVDGVTFRGARANALYVNAPDVKNLTVRRNLFIDTTYGVLVNGGALRAHGIVIDRNRFTGTTGDAVEINTPYAKVADAARDVTVTRNVVRSMRGTGDGSGFGVGMAGVQGFRIAGNAFYNSRNEAVHLEARSRRGVVDGNIVSRGGTGGRPAIAIYRTVDRVKVSRNVIVRFRGSGIAVLWDSVGSSTHITVARNLVRGVSADGIVMGGDTGTGPFVTRDNAVIGAQNGIVTLGVHKNDVVARNLVRDVRGRAVLSEYQGTSRRTVIGNSSAATTTIRSVVGPTVIALAHRERATRSS
jgi:hypothetical protein